MLGMAWHCSALGRHRAGSAQDWPIGSSKGDFWWKWCKAILADDLRKATCYSSDVDTSMGWVDVNRSSSADDIRDVRLNCTDIWVVRHFSIFLLPNSVISLAFLINYLWWFWTCHVEARWESSCLCHWLFHFERRPSLHISHCFVMVPTLFCCFIYMWALIFVECPADSGSLEAFDEEAGTLEIHPFACPSIWRWNGDGHFNTHRVVFLVSICVDLPNSPYVQPSFQPRARNFSHPCWQQPQYWDMKVINDASQGLSFLLCIRSWFCHERWL